VFPADIGSTKICYSLLLMDTDQNQKHASKTQLLVVDDDAEIRELLSLYFREQGFEVATVGDGREMDAWLAENTADLVVLDLMLPGEDGLSIARRLGVDHQLPIVMISARSEEIDRIIGLEVGADDYLPKPFSPRELLARVRAVLRRNRPMNHPEPDAGAGYEFGPYRFVPEKHALYRNLDKVDLSSAEYELLSVFVNHPNQVLSRDLIMDCLGGNEWDPVDRTIDVRVMRLRNKIEENPAQPRLVCTVWGIGYQFRPEGSGS